MKRHLPLIVALLAMACGDAATSPTWPSSPATPTVPPPVISFTIRGEVRDTRNLPISSAQVQVVSGIRTGTAVETDEDGRFVLPGTFSGIVTLRASKEGFHVREKTVPPPDAPTPPVAIVVRIDLEAIDTPIAGTYHLTFAAANECTQLPDIARRRTYRSQLDPVDNGWSIAWLHGDFLEYYSTFYAAVRREPPYTLQLYIYQPYSVPATGIVERIGPRMLLEIRGSAELPLGARDVSVAFDGTFAFCEADLTSSEEAQYRCPVQPVECYSTNHRLTWVRQ
jgi:hypothetical protein